MPMTDHAQEARNRWGDTDAYRAYEQKAACCTPQQMQQNGEAVMQALRDIAGLRPAACDDAAVQQRVRALQEVITQGFYPCTDDILAGLGEMYVQDERFRRNIDKACGEGAAEYVCVAIRALLGKE